MVNVGDDVSLILIPPKGVNLYYLNKYVYM